MSFEPHWKDAFIQLFELCRAHDGEAVTILTESQSRQVNVTLAAAALAEMKIPATILNVPSKPPVPGLPVIRSTGASNALSGEGDALAQLQKSDLVIDLTVEGLMHAPETPAILKAGARIMTISNEHPEILARLRPDPAMKDVVRAAVTACREAKKMPVSYTHLTLPTIPLV